MYGFTVWYGIITETCSYHDTRCMAGIQISKHFQRITKNISKTFFDKFMGWEKTCIIQTECKWPFHWCQEVLEVSSNYEYI